MTDETVKLLLELLGQVQLNVGHPDFADQAARFNKAKRELLDQLSTEDNPLT